MRKMYDDDDLVFLQPFQHYLSHIEMMKGDTDWLCAMKHRTVMS